MIVCFNGQFIPEDQARVSVFDRSFLYGDGIFETIRVSNGGPFRFGPHLERLQRGADFFKIRVPFSAKEILVFCEQVIERNQIQDGVLRINLSRGIGIRGYSPKGAEHPLLVITITTLPAMDSPMRPWHLITSTVTVLANDPLALHKTCNKLHHVLARAEADAAGADEALLLNSQGEVAEATSGNIFWIEGATVCTTPLAAGILPGITRSVLREICGGTGLCYVEKSIQAPQLQKADGLFVTLSSFGVVEITRWDNQQFPSSKLIAQLSDAYLKIVRRETAGLV